MRLSRSAKVILGVVTVLVFLFIYGPLLLVVSELLQRGPDLRLAASGADP